MGGSGNEERDFLGFKATLRNPLSLSLSFSVSLSLRRERGLKGEEMESEGVYGVVFVAAREYG